MLTPCKKLYYSVEAVVYIAYNANQHPISSRDIARQQGLPARYLEQIMQKLVHGGILRGVRGPKGGYVLAKPTSNIRLDDICRLVNDDDLISDLPPTTTLGNQVVRPLWENLIRAFHGQLKEITIADLCGEARDQKIAEEHPHQKKRSAV